MFLIHTDFSFIFPFCLIFVRYCTCFMTFQPCCLSPLHFLTNNAVPLQPRIPRTRYSRTSQTYTRTVRTKESNRNSQVDGEQERKKEWKKEKKEMLSYRYFIPPCKSAHDYQSVLSAVSCADTQILLSPLHTRTTKGTQTADRVPGGKVVVADGNGSETCKPGSGQRCGPVAQRIGVQQQRLQSRKRSKRRHLCSTKQRKRR